MSSCLSPSLRVPHNPPPPSLRAPSTSRPVTRKRSEGMMTWTGALVQCLKDSHDQQVWEAAEQNQVLKYSMEIPNSLRNSTQRQKAIAKLKFIKCLLKTNFHLKIIFNPSLLYPTIIAIFMRFDYLIQYIRSLK